MAKIKSSLKRENDELLERGFALPYLDNGKIKFLKREASTTKKQLRETV